jgi:hypothetical protein
MRVTAGRILAATGRAKGAGLAFVIAVAAGCGSSSGSPTVLSGAIGTWMGDGTQGYDGDGNIPAQSWLNQPTDLTFGPDGRAYIVDWNNHRIRRLRADGTLETFIGRSLPGDWNCQNPADSANCAVPMSETIPCDELALNHPMAIQFAADGTGYLAAWHNHKLEAFVSATSPAESRVHIVAGGQAPGYAGNRGPAAASRLNFVDSVAIDRNGNVFIGDERNRRIRRIGTDDAHTILDVVGTSPAPASSGYAGDGGPATEARLALAPYTVVDGADNPPPGGAMALGPDGTLYVSDTFNHCIRKISPGRDGVVGDGDPAEEIITTLAGTCTTSGSSGDGGPVAKALLNLPEDLEFGPDGKLYVADTGNSVVRRIDLGTGTIDRVAGTGKAGYSGDYGSPLQAQLDSPYGLTFDAAGNLYIADTLNNRIRIVRK